MAKGEWRDAVEALDEFIAANYPVPGILTRNSAMQIRAEFKERDATIARLEEQVQSRHRQWRACTDASSTIRAKLRRVQTDVEHERRQLCEQVAENNRLRQQVKNLTKQRSEALGLARSREQELRSVTRKLRVGTPN